MVNKINCLEQKLHPIALKSMTAAERQKLLEELCALPDSEFYRLWEKASGNTFCYHCEYRKDTTSNGHICGYHEDTCLMPRDGFCRHGVKSNN